LTDLWPHTMHPLAAKQFVAAAPFVATDPQVVRRSSKTPARKQSEVVLFRLHGNDP